MAYFLQRMAPSSFAVIEQLFEEELYESVVLLSSLLLTVYERSPESTPFRHRYQLIVLYATSLYKLKDFKKAECLFMKALHLLKFSNSRAKMGNQTNVTPEVELRFRLHKCLLHLRRDTEAVGVLESIPEKERTAKVDRSLGRLYRAQGSREKAIDSFKRALEKAPYAADILSVLYSLREHKGTGEPNSELNLSKVEPGLEWLPAWDKAQMFLASRSSKAAMLLKELDATSQLTNNTTLLTELGRAYYYAGESSRAMSTLRRVSSLDPLALAGMDILARLFATSPERSQELELLTNRIVSAHDLTRENRMDSLSRPEPLICFGYLSKSQDDLVKALFFAHKACSIGLHSSEQALLLKGEILLETKKFREASLHFRELLALSPKCFDAHQLAVQTLLQRGKGREAEQAAHQCVDIIGSVSPRAVALYATTLALNEDNYEKAEILLEQVMRTAPFLLDAAYALVKIYDKRGKYGKCVELLQKQARLHVKSKIHQLLGEYLQKMNQTPAAVDDLRTALLDVSGGESGSEGPSIQKMLADLEDDAMFVQHGSSEQDFMLDDPQEEMDFSPDLEL